ncbi:IS110 family transposase [Dyella acidisoli]|uniref:IS110 family transposase n=1 Tax=Dyella acidisoli TaxID=1867834 RepID=A0ABQ5XJZ9_9GAMM|nr:IS110 family transposase [Dyella acidisoli]GLQ91975.1 IS110 family transposase [Dyella acidisoli]
MHATTVAIDLAKDVFELAFADAEHRIVERKRLTRRTFAHALDNRGPLRVVMEACSSAHYWARRFTGQGHTVCLLPARDVRPYVRRNKTDRTDVAGILEADRCAQINPVPIKSPEQQGIQALHRIRERLKAQHTSTINLLRGVLREFGLVIPLGASKVRPTVLTFLEDGDNDLPMALRHTLGNLLDRLANLHTDMTAIEQQLEAFAQRDPTSQRYQSVPGIGLLTATALCASVGPLDRFRSGRHFAAWLGLTPREHSSGAQRHLGAMSKRGDGYLRLLLIHGARAALRAAQVRQRKDQPLNHLQAWALALQARQGHNKAAVAMANKMARRMWAMEHHHAAFDSDYCSVRPLQTREDIYMTD